MNDEKGHGIPEDRVRDKEDAGDDAPEGVGATRDGGSAAAALPDAGSLALDRGLAAEGALVLGVLGDLDLLHDLTERSTVASTILADNADLLSALTLHGEQ